MLSKAYKRILFFNCTCFILALVMCALAIVTQNGVYVPPGLLLDVIGFIGFGFQVRQGKLDRRKRENSYWN